MQTSTEAMEYNEKISRIASILAGPKYGTLDEQERKLRLNEFLSYQYRRKGQGALPGGMMDTIDLLDEDISRYYGRSLSYAEVELAIDWGLHGEYGEFTGMNADRLFRFVRSYTESPERTEGQKRANVMSQQPDSAGADIGRLNWETVCGKLRSLWDEYLRTGTVFMTEANYGGFPIHHARFHCAENCYRWMKMFGFVRMDDDTIAAERQADKQARSIKRQYVPNDRDIPGLQEAISGTLMLQNVFSVIKSSGCDLLADIDEIEMQTPAKERQFY